jgi:DNA helicase-2/ATP-dependent DNA helicase PcrA
LLGGNAFGPPRRGRMTAPNQEPELNEEQRAAIQHGEGPLLVVAGAGTGKTRVITERICHLLRSRPELSGENILGLTFTDKAAAEMKTRLRTALGERAENVWLGTFHAFCLEVVLRDLRPDWQVVEDMDHWILLRRHLGELELALYKRLADPGQFLNDFIKFFSRCQDELVTPDDYDRHVEELARRAGRTPLDLEAAAEEQAELERQKEIARAYRASDGLVRAQKAHTFGQMLLDAVRELRAHPELLARLRKRFRYILVDEFQDTNIAQIELLGLLAGESPPGNLVAVGDDDQAIYRFRGASFGSFKLFAEKFLAANPGAPRAATGRPAPGLSLFQNYRSTRRILRVANQVIAQNRDRYMPDKRLVTSNPEGAKIRIAEFPAAEAEAAWVTSELLRLHHAGRPWSSFAVLYRQHAHNQDLVRALALAGIPFVVKNISILGNTLVRDVLAYLRLLIVPSDNIAAARVLAAPAWGLEPSELVRLAERAGGGKSVSLLEELANPQGGFAFSRTSAAGLPAWLESLRALSREKTAGEVFEALVAQLGITLLPSDADWRYLDRLARFLADWEAKSETKSLGDFIEYLNYYFERDEPIRLDEEPADDAVQLMTVHAAKGLEFDSVFILRLTQGSFPPRNRRALLEFPAELMKEAKPEGDFRIQEERRLFYVALTRARRELALTAVVGPRQKPSPFLEDILSAPEIQRRDVEQTAPKMQLPPAEPAAAPLPAGDATGKLFPRVPAECRAYSRITLWALNYSPPLFEPLSLSASAIETYQTCPLKYLFQQIWKLRGGPQAATTFGSVMHTTIREVVAAVRKGRAMPFEEVAAIYQREWSAAGYRDAYQEEAYRQAGLEQLQAFHARYAAAPADVLYQEKGFTLPLEPNIEITGRMDQVNRIRGREVEIVDYKTGQPRDSRDAAKSLQLSLYALAAREILELEPTRLVLYNLATNEPIVSARSEEALEKARATVAEVADQIRAREFPARPGYHCRTCDFRPICPAHEQWIAFAPASPPKS